MPIRDFSPRKSASRLYWRLRSTLSRWSPTKILFRLAGSIFDRRYGIETSVIVPVDRLDSGGENAAHAHRYNPTLMGFTAFALRRIGINHRDFVFVDIGSGKGRVLLEATFFPFQRIVGVEFSPALHRDAEHSVSRYIERTGRGHNIELQCIDATDFAIPDENIVLYLYNPFDREVMARVLGNIQESLRRDPRLIKIIYLNPVDADLFDTSDTFMCLRSGRFAGEEFRLYTSKFGG